MCNLINYFHSKQITNWNTPCVQCLNLVISQRSEVTDSLYVSTEHNTALSMRRMLLGIQSNIVTLQLAVLCRDFITCFGDDSGILADANRVAEATDVFAEHSKGILVPHDQVRHSAAGPAVVLIDREPFLMRERERGGET